ncbi:hypothetical protein [Streptomyces sp. NPDC051909]|uniref:hypothetical protein n=1 Tax=Streptomyces sp. NPDC051909 TaxID=3154944 RepID=UPI00343E7ABA
MTLVGPLRREEPFTAARAAGLTGESVAMALSVRVAEPLRERTSHCYWTGQTVSVQGDRTS